MKMNGRSSVKATLAIGALLVASGVVVAYEPETHEALSEQALFRSSLIMDATLAAELGLADFGSPPRFPSSTGQDGTIVELIRYGANLEDRIWWDFRSCHHFFDPIYNEGLSLPCPADGPNQRSPDWALEPSAIASQDFSYADAVEAYRLAVVSGSPAARKQQWGRVFQRLGHVVHHVEDMAQPQHVRDDAHLPGSTNWYEEYTQGKYQQGKLFELTEDNPYHVTLPTARSFWTTGLDMGLADFTNKNFVSEDTNFRLKNGTVSPNAEYSQPVPKAGGGETVSLPNLYEPGPDRQAAADLCQRLKTDPLIFVPGGADCLVEFIGNDVKDEYANGSVTLNRRASSISLFDTRLTEVNGTLTRPDRNTMVYVDRAVSMNSFNFNAAHRFLIPRAVAYATGLIDHFFKARLALSRPASTGWSITNVSPEVLIGTFSLYYEDNSGNRGLVAGASYMGTVLANQTVPVVFPEPPIVTKNLLAVFVGRFGSETQTHVGSLVRSYSPPPVACGGTRNAEGGIEGLEAVYELGTSAGTVEIEFEAYSVPDSITVMSENGAKTTFATSNGMMSGFRKWAYNYDPTVLGSTLVRVKIVGSEEGTAWALTIGCPGQTLSNSDRAAPLRNVTFRFGAPNDPYQYPPASGACSAAFFVDGAYIGTATTNSFDGSQLSAILSQGPMHSYSYGQMTCQVNSQNLSFSVKYTDPAGTFYLNRFGTGGYFDVH